MTHDPDGLPDGVELYTFDAGGEVVVRDERGARSLGPGGDLLPFIDDGQFARYFIGDAQDLARAAEQRHVQAGRGRPAQRVHAARARAASTSSSSLGHASCGLYDAERGRVAALRLAPGTHGPHPGACCRTRSATGPARPLLILAANTGFGIDHEDYAITAAQAARARRRRPPGLAKALRGAGRPARRRRADDWRDTARDRPAPGSRTGWRHRVMICPHCARDLGTSSGAGDAARYCKRHFAFEPKANKLRLHDLKVRKLADRLSDNGRPSATRSPSSGTPRPARPLAAAKTPLSGCGCGLSVLGCRRGRHDPLVGQADSERSAACCSASAVVVVLAYVLLVRGSLAGCGARPPIDPPVPLGEFRDMILRRWRRGVRQQLPHDLVDEETGAPRPAIAQPRARAGLPGPVGRSRACGVNGVAEDVAR